jgi:hypothetical protein
MAEQKDLINGFLDMASLVERRSVDVAQDLVGDKKDVKVTFQTKLTEPTRAESPRRCHVFNTVDGFADYLQRFGSHDIVILADPQTGYASACLDETATQGFEVVHFRPIVHPFWGPWLERLGEYDDIRSFAEFVSCQRHVIVSPDPKALFMVLSQVRLCKRVTVESGIGAKSLNGIMVETEVSGNSVKARVDLPDEIKLCTPIYWGAEPSEIVVDMIVRANDGVDVKLVSSDADRKRVEAIEGMMGSLVAKLPEAVVTFGAVDHAPWKYIYEDGYGIGRVDTLPKPAKPPY